MTIDVKCTCLFCGRLNNVKAPVSGLRAWENGELIQKALPTLSLDERELLKTGICSKCWKERL